MDAKVVVVIVANFSWLLAVGFFTMEVVSTEYTRPWRNRGWKRGLYCDVGGFSVIACVCFLWSVSLVRNDTQSTM